MPCPICKTRKAKRFCPAKGEKICSICCGLEREETIDCPFDCRYLQESREREYKGGIDPKDFPYQDVRIGETFLRDHDELLAICGRAIFEGAVKIPKAADRDVREALDALIQTYKTLGSGIYYETRPESAYARDILSHIQQELKAFQDAETRQTGFSRTHDSDIFQMLVFLYRMALDRDNGRSRGKAFLDFLRVHFRPADTAPAAAPSLILPGR